MCQTKLEAIVRKAACHTFGAGSSNFDEWIVTNNPDDEIEVDGFDLGTTVELFFDTPISPVCYFNSDVTFFVSVSPNEPELLLSSFWGNSCHNIDAANASASEFFDREERDGWAIAQEFETDCGLHLGRVISLNTLDDNELFHKLSHAFMELLERETADKLRSFIHYFED